jgi:excisionase family DNA binding protein
MKTLLTPKDLADALGTSESSMRRWIDSGRVRMSRTAGGHRRIEVGEAMRFIRAMGLPVIRPEALGLDAISELAAVTDRAAGAGGAGVGAGTPPENIDCRLLGALTAGDRAMVRGMVVSWYLSGRGLATLFDGAMRHALTKLGEPWTADRAAILTEHRAADICVEAINALRAMLPRPNGNARIAIGGTPNDEWHSIPSLMAAMVACESGMRDVNYGANVPIDLLARAAADEKARLVWLSITMPPRRGMRAELAKLGADLAGHGATLVVGGRHALDACPPKHPNVHCVQSMSELNAFIHGMRG